MSKQRTTLLGFVGVLLLIELVVRSPGVWLLDENSSTGMVLPTVEAALEGIESPDIVFLGSSRFQHNISPIVVAQNLKRGDLEVVNISFQGGTPLDYDSVYRENRNVLGDAKILVVDISARDFKWGDSATFRNRFRWRASLAERLVVPDWQEQSDMSLGWLWRTWDARFMLRGYLGKMAREKATPTSFPKRDIPRDELHRTLAQDEPDLNFHITEAYTPELFLPEIRPTLDFKDYEFFEPQLKHLQNLVAMTDEDGVKVLLLETPVSDVSQMVIDKSYREEDAFWRDKVENALGMPVTMVPLNGGVCADWKDCYVDYGHMNRAGARAFSEILGDWITSQSPEALAADNGA